MTICWMVQRPGEMIAKLLRSGVWLGSGTRRDAAARLTTARSP